MISLPHNLRLTYLYQDKELDLSDWTPMIVHDNGTLETKDGKLQNKSMKKVIKALSGYSCIFTYSPPGKNDTLLSSLKHDDLIKLSLFGKLELEGHMIKRFKNTLVFDGTPVINLIALTKKHHEESLESVDLLAREIISSRQKTFGVFNLSSPAAEARALMAQSDEVFDEILLSRALKLPSLDKFNAACHGGRMESSGIGTEWQTHIDMVKAHLSLLEQYPGLRGTDWFTNHHGLSNYDDALPHSVYRISVEIPPKFKFHPLPVKTPAGLKYPSGKIVGWYTKDYTNLLNRLGIKFKILDSIQFFGEPTYPFRGLCDFIRGVTKLWELDHPGLESKHLYATIAGNCKSIFRNLEEDLSETQVTSKCFDPLVYAFVLSRQNVRLYEEALELDASAIKIDALATPKRVESPEGYAVKGEGVSTYLTPALKTTPGGKPIYRDAILRNQDKDHVVIEMSVWNSLSSHLSETLRQDSKSVSLGEKYTHSMIIKPSFGNRRGHRVRKVGSLLDNWFSSSPQRGIRGGTPEEDFNTLQLEAHLKRFQE